MGNAGRSLPAVGLSPWGMDKPHPASLKMTDSLSTSRGLPWNWVETRDAPQNAKEVRVVEAASPYCDFLKVPFPQTRMKYEVTLGELDSDLAVTQGVGGVFPPLSGDALSLLPIFTLGPVLTKGIL